MKISYLESVRFIVFTTSSVQVIARENKGTGVGKLVLYLKRQDSGEIVFCLIQHIYYRNKESEFFSC
jgi:hypothetical protein